MATDGWIKLFRQMQYHPLWTDHKFSPGQAWVDMLLMASHKPHQAIRSDNVFTVERGEILTSKVALAKRWGWDRRTVARYLVGLERGQMCCILRSIRGDIGYTLISITNYETYQHEGKRRAHSKVHSEDHSLPIQSPFSPHIQECKNVKNERKEEEEEEGKKTPAPLIFDPETEGGGDFIGSDRERLSKTLRERYLEEFGEQWIYAEYRGICRWCVDNPRKLAAKKSLYKFVLACFGGAATRERKRG